MSRVLLVGPAAAAALPRSDHTGIARHTIRRCVSAVDALVGFESFGPDVVVTEFDMPELSGLDLARILRAHPFRMAIPVILLAARRLVPPSQTQYFAAIVDGLVPVAALIDELGRTCDGPCRTGKAMAARARPV